VFKRFAVVVLLLLAGPAWADPALWVARGPRANVYILGSVHMLRPGVTWESPAIRRAFDEARECWFEAVLPDDPAAMQTMMISMGLDPAHKLTDLLPPNRRAQFEELAASTGMGAAMQAMRPWLAAVVLVGQPLLKAGYDPALGVDTVLQARAKAAGKPIAGIETAEAQMQLLSGLPPDLALKFLLSALDDAAEGPALVERMVGLWQSADTDGLASVVTGRLLREAPELYRIVFTRRNEVFARAVQGLLAGDQTVLVTVGAGHLAGPDNVRDLLERKGVKVERVAE